MVALVLGLIFLYSPFFLIMIHSFHPTDFFLYYKQFLTNFAILNGIFVSVKLAFTTTLIGLGVSLLVVLAIKNEHRVWSDILLYQFVLSDLSMSISLFGMFVALNIPTSIYTLGLSYIIVNTASGAAIILQNLQSDKHHDKLTQAAQDLGASYFNIARYITIPRLREIIISTGLWNASHVLEDVIFVNFLSGPSVSTLSMVMLARMREGIDLQLNALSSCIVLLFIVVNIVTLRKSCVKNVSRETL